MPGFMPGIHVIAQMAFCLSMIFSENRFPLCAAAALRVGIML
jgi:hypothetical protein